MKATIQPLFKDMYMFPHIFNLNYRLNENYWISGNDETEIWYGTNITEKVVELFDKHDEYPHFNITFFDSKFVENTGFIHKRRKFSLECRGTQKAAYQHAESIQIQIGIPNVASAFSLIEMHNVPEIADHLQYEIEMFIEKYKGAIKLSKYDI